MKGKRIRLRNEHERHLLEFLVDQARRAQHARLRAKETDDQWSRAFHFGQRLSYMNAAKLLRASNQPAFGTTK